MKIFVQLISFFLFNKFIKAEKLDKGTVKTKEGPSGKVGTEHEDSSSVNDVIIKISENKKKKGGSEKGKAKGKKQVEKSKAVPAGPSLPPAVPDSTYQVPTSNILFKDLDTKKVEIAEKDYKELIESSKMMAKALTGLQKILQVNNNIIRKMQSLNPPKEDSKPRDLFNIKVIEVSDDVKSSK